eukprot:6208347-Pleurochrysis_carterae.AAC.2
MSQRCALAYMRKCRLSRYVEHGDLTMGEAAPGSSTIDATRCNSCMCTAVSAAPCRAQRR